ncbi:MAG: recombinase family protein [Candidatus Methylomirabilales bacterium]
MLAELRWVTPTYTALHHVLTSPVYAGAYVYGKPRHERYLDTAGHLRKRVRHLPRAEWEVLLSTHHAGFIGLKTYERNQARIAGNTRLRSHTAGGAVREGAALLQGIGTCGRCGRRLKAYYQGKRGTPGYYCPSSLLVNGRGSYCLRVGGAQLDEAVAQTFLATVTPAHGCCSPRSASCCARSAPMSGRCGPPRPLRIAIARSCCAPCSKRSTSRFSAPSPAPS